MATSSLAFVPSRLLASRMSILPATRLLSIDRQSVQKRTSTPITQSPILATLCERTLWPQARSIATSSRPPSQRRLRIGPVNATQKPPALTAAARPSIDDNVPPLLDWRVPEADSRAPLVLRAILFFGATSAAIFAWAAWSSVSDTSRIAEEIRPGNGIFGDFSSFLSGTDTDSAAGGVSQQKLQVAKRQELAAKMGWQLTWLLGWCDQLYLPKETKDFVGWSYTWLAQRYLQLPDAKAVVVPILAINVGVFLAISLGRTGAFHGTLMRFMSRNFMHAPAANRMRTMATAAFSHAGLAHLFFNCYAIYSFAGFAFAHPRFLRDANGKHLHTAEASLWPQFLAFFLTAGMFASLSSHIVHRIMFEQARRTLGEQAARLSIGRIPSLGSSGSGYAIVSMFALAFGRDAEIGIPFLPIHAPAQDFFACLVALDLLGLLATVSGRYKSGLDHAAHLGGALFGYLYFKFGNPFWEGCKQVALQAQQKDGRSTDSTKGRPHPTNAKPDANRTAVQRI